MKFINYIPLILIIILLCYVLYNTLNKKENFISKNVYTNENVNAVQNNNGFLHSLSTFSDIYINDTTSRCVTNNLINEYDSLQNVENLPSENNNYAKYFPLQYDGVYKV